MTTMTDRRRRAGHGRRRLTARPRIRRGLASVLATIATALMLVTGITVPTYAAGDAVLSVSMTPVHPLTGDPMTSVGNDGVTDGGGFGYRISYSCNVVDCMDATIQLSETPLDPNYSHYRPFSFNTWTPPFVGATISGDDVTGRTISLGDLAAGASGSFIVSYTWTPRGGLSNQTPVPASFLPNGFPIVMSSTMESSTAVAPVTGTSQPISWVSSIQDPTLSVTGVANVDTDVNYTVQLNMGSNCVTWFGQYFGGDARYTCARDYEVVYQLPAEATFVSTTADGVYDAGTHTVTWTQGPATGHLPAVGWQRGGGGLGLAQPRTVVVQFDNAAFSSTGDIDHCNFTQPVTSTVTMNMTYLGQNISDVSDTRSLTRTLTTNVSCYEPFAKGIFNGKASSFDGTTRLVGSTVSPVVVQSDTDPNLHFWDVSVGNQANVPGVATIAEPDLAVEGTRPTRIEALNFVNGPVATGYSVAWELDNGDTGSGPGPVTAPVGNWFVAATVTSAPLAAANLVSTGTAQTTFVARFHYEVAGDAPVGERRANTATASITYPDHPELGTLALGSRTHSVEFVAPFARAVSTKLSSSNGNINVPTVGTTNQFWDIRVTNTSNVTARAIIEDNDLDNKPGRITSVTQYAANHVGTSVPVISYTLNTGATGTSATSFTAPPGTWITSVHAESWLLNPVNAYTNQNSPNSYYMLRLGYVVDSSTPTGTWTNTAQVQLTYPGMGVATTDLGDITGTATFRNAPVSVNAAFTSTPVVDAGGQAAPGRTVTFTAGAVTGGVIDEVFTPQYVFIAPLNWIVTPGSAQVPGAPAGATFNYRTVTIGGQERSVVVATWPDGTTFGENGAWPDMTVQAQPTFAAAAGSSGIASFWAGESSNGWTTADVTFGSPITDTMDIDGDGNITEGFSQANSAAVSVGSADAISVLKEICRPDDSAADGCDWVSDPSQPIHVSTVAGGIPYRITVQNSGNTPLADVVAYDVLPHIGDTGLIAATAGTPRGSMFNQVLANVSNVSGNLTLSYSASTNPARPEVNPGASGTVDDWNASFSGKVAIRAAVTGTLAPGATASFNYMAAVGAGADADAIACNSVAVSSNRTLPSEPSAVCALTSEADLEARGVSVISAQLERPTVMPFEFESLGDSAETSATVVIDIPAGVTVPALGIAGWTCTAPGGAPVEGPATIECTPEAPLSLGVTLPLPLPVIIHDAAVSVTASISGPMYDPDNTNNAHTISVPVPTAAVDAGLVVSKTDGRSALIAGQQTSYTITVQNPLDFEALGVVTITDTLPPGLSFVSATDDGTLVGNEVTWTIPTIPAQGTVTVTVIATVDPTAAGDIVNTVSATTDDPALPGQTLTGTDDDVNTLDAIAFTKTTDPVSSSALPGELVTYRFEVENIGTGTVSDVQIVDTLSGLSAITFGIWPGAPGVLPEGESVTASATYTLTQADIDAGVLVNGATAHADSAGGGELAVSDDVTLTFDAGPALTFEKTGVLVDGLSVAGATVLFTFTVENTGNVSVSDLTIADSMPGLSAIVLAGDNTLDAAEQVTGTATYVLTQADVDAGSVTNDATVSGTPARGTLTPVNDDATVSIAAAPELTLVKTGVSQNPSDPQVGDEVTFTFEVENTGNVTVSGISLTDTMSGLSAITGAVTELAPGESFTATATYELTSDDLDHGSVENDATVTGVPARGTLAPAVDSVKVMLPADASLTFTKTGVTEDPVHPEVGDIVTFTFTVENTGPVTVDTVTIVDDMPDLSSITMVFPGVNGRLATGESAVGTATYTLTQADIDRGNVVNDATVTGVPARGYLDPVEAHAEVLLVAVPAVTLDKTVSAAPNPQAGDEVTFTFEVENTGNVTLSGITLTDEMPGLGTLADTEATLAPGESFTATAVYELTQADIDDGTIVNDATLSADPARGILLDVIDEVELQLEALPRITLVKSAPAPSAPRAGDEVTFTFEVENTGNVTLRDLEVIDLMTGLSLVNLDGAAGDFSPGAVVTGTAVYVLTQADLDAGTITNAATATATAVRGDDPGADDAIDVPLEALPALTLVKTGMAADAVRPMAGDEVIFTFTVTNTGNVTVEDIELSDAFPGISAIDAGTFAGTLAPDESFVATAVYPLTQDDIDAGGIENEATVTGDPVRGVVDPVDAHVEIPLNAVPGLELVKEGVLTDSDGGGLANPGESVEYIFTLTNTGNVTLTDVTVDDPKVAVIGTVARLAPGESATLTSEAYTVTGQDALDGVVRNTATAGGQTPTGEVQSSNEALSLLDSGFRPEQPRPLVMTGANIGLPLSMGVLLLLIGAGLMFVRRRQNSEE